MWIRGTDLFVWAADGPSGSGTDQLIIILGGIIVAAITAGGTVLVAVVNARTNRTAPSPPSPTSAPPTADALTMHEDIAVLRYRADDADERDEIQDRRLDQLERHLDMENPRWRRPPDGSR